MEDSFSRRAFLGALSAGSLVPGLASAQTYPLDRVPVISRELWPWMRSQLLIDPGTAWFDTARFGPTLRAVVSRAFRSTERQSTRFPALLRGHLRSRRDRRAARRHRRVPRRRSGRNRAHGRHRRRARARGAGPRPAGRRRSAHDHPRPRLGRVPLARAGEASRHQGRPAAAERHPRRARSHRRPVRRRAESEDEGRRVRARAVHGRHGDAGARDLRARTQQRRVQPRGRRAGRGTAGLCTARSRVRRLRHGLPQVVERPARAAARCSSAATRNRACGPRPPTARQAGTRRTASARPCLPPMRRRRPRQVRAARAVSRPRL